MLTIKDKLLIRPWIDQKYESHLRKVKSAKPAIDFRAPTKHEHVTVKLKKIQCEKERLNEIAKENQRLLQRLCAIMNTGRIDNYWRQPPPSFLKRHRIIPEPLDFPSSIVHRSSKSSTQQVVSPNISITTTNEQLLRPKTSYVLSRCLACSKIPIKKNKIIPEERVPWAPVKKSWNCKFINGVLNITGKSTTTEKSAANGYDGTRKFCNYCCGVDL